MDICRIGRLFARAFAMARPYCRLRVLLHNMRDDMVVEAILEAIFEAIMIQTAVARVPDLVTSRYVWRSESMFEGLGKIK